MSKIHKDCCVLRHAVIKAVESFLLENPGLLSLSAHEQAMSHRIAYYLEAFFQRPGDEVLKIDCEYNKHLHGDKTFDLGAIDLRTFKPCGCRACEAIAKGKWPDDERCFRPDIVVHQRNTDKNNLLAIEIKKKKVCSFDIEKLKALTRAKENGGEYCYTLGAFLYFAGGKAQYMWFP